MWLSMGIIEPKTIVFANKNQTCAHVSFVEAYSFEVKYGLMVTNIRKSDLICSRLVFL